jgi:hypothetical protein
MAEAQKDKTAPAAAPTTDAAKPAVKKVYCFVSKREINESDAIEMPYTNGQKVWVGKEFVKFQQ